jgi:hypothetical protein
MRRGDKFLLSIGESRSQKVVARQITELELQDLSKSYKSGLNPGIRPGGDPVILAGCCDGLGDGLGSRAKKETKNKKKKKKTKKNKKLGHREFLTAHLKNSRTKTYILYVYKFFYCRVHISLLHEFCVCGFYISLVLPWVIFLAFLTPLAKIRGVTQANIIDNVLLSSGNPAESLTRLHCQPT